MYEEIEITEDFLMSFRNEDDFYDWLVETEETHEILDVINDIINVLTDLHLEKLVMKAMQFKKKYL